MPGSSRRKSSFNFQTDASYLPSTPQKQKGAPAAAYLTPSPTPARSSIVSYTARTSTDSPVTPVKSRGQVDPVRRNDLLRGFQGPPITNNEECRPNPFTPSTSTSKGSTQQLATPPDSITRHHKPTIKAEYEEETSNLYDDEISVSIKSEHRSMLSTPPVTPLKLKAKYKEETLTLHDDDISVSIKSEHQSMLSTPPVTSLKLRSSSVKPKGSTRVPISNIMKEEKPKFLQQSQFDNVTNTGGFMMLPAHFLNYLDEKIRPYVQMPNFLSATSAISSSPIPSEFGSESLSSTVFDDHENKPSPRIKEEESVKDEKSVSSSVQTKATNKTPISTYLTLNGKFKSGEQLSPYQLNDVFRLVDRELGETVCRTDSWNNIGYILAYEMGLGKTVVSIALSILNPPEDEFVGARATLVIVPNQTMMNQWRSEIQKFAPHLGVCYYNSIRAELRPNADIVLLTHAQLRNQHRAKLANPKSLFNCPLYQYFWYRIILDEAHCARNPATKIAEAIWDINKQHGLCLTGTPVQNSIVDFYSLFRFLGVEYEDIHDLSHFERKVYAKRQKGRISDPRAQEILDTVKESFCIFRSKVDSKTGEVLVDLPPRKDMVIELSLTKGERLIYLFVERHKLQILAKLTRLRQACEHPLLVAQGLKDDLVYAEEGEDYDFMAASLSPGTVNKLPKSVKMIFERGDRYQSSKLREMLRILKKHEGQKTIVFTHFTSMIKPIGNALDRAGIVWTEYTGGMTPKQQQETLKELAEDDKYAVIIISITAGSTGLNITCCNNVILLEPWWNPFAEEQAIARVHRIGQTLPVTVYRLITKDSLEESIVATQDSKYEMAENIYGP